MRKSGSVSKMKQIVDSNTSLNSLNSDQHSIKDSTDRSINVVI
jgi:hypothetical protein